MIWSPADTAIPLLALLSATSAVWYTACLPMQPISRAAAVASGWLAEPVPEVWAKTTIGSVALVVHTSVGTTSVSDTVK